MYTRSNIRRFPTQAVPVRRVGLSGLGQGTFIVFVMPDNTTRQVTSPNDPNITAYLQAGGKPIRPGGGYYNVSTLLGGYLFDNCPLNVILGEGWVAGQQEALANAGLTPSCPQIQTAAPAVMAPTVAVTPIQGPATGTPVTTVNAPQFVASTTTATLPAAGTGSAAPTTTVYQEAPTVTPGAVNSVTPVGPATDNTLLYIALAIGAYLLLK